MLVAWMAPAETGASDLSPKGTMQPLRRAVGKSAAGADSRPCDKSTFPLCTGELWKGGYGSNLLSSSPHWWLARDVVQMWPDALLIRR